MPSASENDDLAYEALQTMSNKKISAKVMVNSKHYICRVETRGEHLIRREEEAMAKAEAEAAKAAAAVEEENENAEDRDEKTEKPEVEAVKLEDEAVKLEDEAVKLEDEFGASRVQSSGAISAMASSSLANTFSAPPSVKSSVSAATTISASPAVQVVKKLSMCDI